MGKGRYTLPLGNAGTGRNGTMPLSRTNASCLSGEGGQGKTGTMAGPGKEALMLTARFAQQRRTD
ncbi:hypothetical protein VCV18_004370 [Metarhizium anisopliae]